MLDEKMTGVLDQLFNRAIISLRTLMSSLRMGKTVANTYLLLWVGNAT